MCVISSLEMLKKIETIAKSKKKQQKKQNKKNKTKKICMNEMHCKYQSVVNFKFFNSQF